MAAVVVIAGVAACAIYLSSGDDGGKEYGDSYLEGYWYQIEYEGYVDDVYIHTDDSNKNTTPFNIEIIECHDNVLYGTFHNKYFSGTYANKTMSFYGSYGEMSAMVSGYVGNDGRLHLTIIQQGDSITGALSAVYSKDPLDRCDIPGSIDVAGAWTVSKARAVDTAGNVYALSGNELTITESKGPVFKGIMEQQIEGKIISLDCWGVVSDRSVNGYRAGYMTCNGENWNVSISPYEFVLQTSMIDDTGNTDSIVAIERSYISDSTEARPSFYSLDNTSWSLYNSYDASYSHIEERYFDFVMKFDNQEDTLLSGSMRFGGTEYEMVGYLTRAGELCVFGDYISSNIYGCGWVNEDSITLCEWYGDYTTVFNFKSADQNSMMTDRNMVGHWSGLCAATLDESNEVTETNNQNIDRSGLYGLDIYASSNGMFYGNFRDTFITGEIIDSRLSFSAVLSDGSTVYFWGTMDGKVMDSMEIYYKSDDTMLVRNSIYSKDGSMYGEIDVSSPDLAKSWKSPSGYSVIYDGEKSTILGENLVMNFNDEYGRFITGTIEEEVAGEVKNLKYLGIMGRSDNPVDGFLLDENGHFYYITVIDGTMSISTMALSDTQDVGKFIVVERLYKADGTTPTVPSIGFDLTGTIWESKDGIRLDSEGNKTKYEGIKLEFTGQEWDLIIGTVDDSAVKIGGLGYTENGVDYIEFAFSDNVDDIGTLTIKDGKMILSLHSLEDGKSVMYRFELKQTN